MQLKVVVVVTQTFIKKTFFKQLVKKLASQSVETDCS